MSVRWSGQVLAPKAGKYAFAANGRFQQYHSGVPRDRFPDDASLRPQRVRAHFPDYPFCRLGRN